MSDTSMEYPVVIGGGGGSGTRVVAEILKRCDYHMGADLNEANDNLLFTMLFRRLGWYQSTLESYEDRTVLVDLFHRLSWGLPCRSGMYAQLMRAAVDHTLHHVHIAFPKSAYWAVVRMRVALGTSRQRFTMWGWKEPNAHIYLPELVNYYPYMKYIHVIRHGLDMAYSTNQLQLRNWHFNFGIGEEEMRQCLPRASLKYWIVSNRRAINIAKTKLQENFLLIRFEDLCEHPEDTIKIILSFLNPRSKSLNIDDLKALVKKSSTIGRYRVEDLGVFDSDQIKDLEEFGYCV